MTADIPTADLTADLAWLGAHAASRLREEVHLDARTPLAATITTEVSRLRALSPGTAGTLRLLDLPAAEEAQQPQDVLAALRAAGEESYAVHGDGPDLTVIAAGGASLLHAFYASLRAPAADAGREIAAGWSLYTPTQPIRMLDHWDNMLPHPVMGQVERGYAGGSLFFTDGELREDLSRVEHYARLLAAIGINRVSLNNVNVHAREATLLTERRGAVARLAEIFRAHGIRVLLSVSFASPMMLGGLPSNDPLDPAVQAWWRTTATALYAEIPDFGGFVVKADSEGQPGPFAYGRNHADGANLLARALRPHGGEVFWRAFVYDHRQDWRDRSTDRARAAHDHFAPLDGAFDENVILQVKHGPMDFQTREAVSPVLGVMPRTRLAVELQVTQEYTGQQKHVCYLGPWWHENLLFRFGGDDAATVADLVAGTAERPGGVVAVSNVGDDAFWTGHPLAQANLYALGRLAWDPQLGADEILAEWIRITFGTDALVAEVLTELLAESWALYESYTAPLGVGFMVRPGHHYGPDVDGYEYTPWGTYHFADRDGIGVDRSVATGTGFAGLFPEPWASRYESPETCPDELLLFFHHVPYTHRLHSGKTVIQHIYDSRADGYERVLELRPRWLQLAGRVPEALHARVTSLLEEQERSAQEWRDQLRSYFHRASGIADETGRRIY
ncbi:alpha-glucuronidase [Brachybacterium sp. J144]|uniref:alpha-glucuronidase n=1 Tax=Brachybacterium sp. J144 TaxID=3116487 RepID=UPI002E7A8029|nr:alpha-glucuronidase [Brachybacterium sp. J144]MEE1650201.1 alpha-glucuronidase [Brachybacterium sp. J144]